MPKQAAKSLFLSPFPLGEGPGMGPYVLIGGFYVYPLNSYLIFIKDSTCCDICGMFVGVRPNQVGHRFEMMYRSRAYGGYLRLPDGYNFVLFM